jgi:predicted kinase
MSRDEVLAMLAGEPGSKRFVMFIGLPSSGKSNLAKALVRHGLERLCVDKLQKRNPVLGLQPYLLMGYFFDLLKTALKEGRRIVDDNPNLRPAGRQKVLKMVAQAGYTDIILVHMNTPLDICLERNSGRSRVVSDAQIHEMWRDFEKSGMPQAGEGKIVRITSRSVHDDVFSVAT